MHQLGQFAASVLAKVQSLAMLFCILVLFFTGVLSYTRAGMDMRVYAAPSSTLNFQARLLTSAGNTVPDGYYNLRFNLYSVVSGGSSLWNEEYYDANGATAGSDNRVRVVNGYFSVNLGSQTVFPGSINWDQEHWLTMNVGGSVQTATPTYDGEMSPRLKLTAVPHAFSASQLIATNNSNRGVLGFDTLTSPRSILLPDQDGTLCIQGSPDCVDVDTTGTTATTSSNSGLETDSSGLRLLGGCGDGQMLRWNSTTDVWECSSGTGSSVTVRESDGTPTTSVTNALEFGPGTNSDTEFIISNEGGGVTRVRIGTSILTTGNYGSTLDSVYVNETQSPAAGDVSGSFTAGLSVNDVQDNAVDLGAETVGDYVQNLGTLVGLSTAGNSGEGSTPGLSVLYGSGANTAVQGNTQITCPSGSGDLSGGGTVITLGAGGTCGNITISEAPVFDTSVTTPLLTYAGALTVQTTATGGADDLIFKTAGTEVMRLLENGNIYLEKGTNDVTIAVNTPGAPATYTFDGATGTVLTTANYAGNLDATYVNTGESPAAGDVSGSFTAGLLVNSVQNNSVDLGTDTVGNYVATITAGSGLSGDATGEGSVSTISVNTGNGLEINSDEVRVNQDYNFTWTNSQIWNLSETEGLNINTSVSGGNNSIAETITITNASTSGTQSGLYIDNAPSSGTTDSLLVFDNSDADTAVTNAIRVINAGGGFTNLFDIAGTLISVSEFTVLDGGLDESEVVGEIESVAAGNGLTGGGTDGAVSLAVAYGSGANTAVQGNTQITCPSGSGDLSGGGTVITLGAGGTCGNITISEAPVFDTSVTTPLLTYAGALTVQTTATGGADDLIFKTAGTEVMRLLENGNIYLEKGTNDVTIAVNTPGAPATYTFDGATGTILTTANYATNLDATYVNTGESPAAGDISGSFSGGFSVNDVQNNAVDLGGETVGDYVQNLGTLTGLSTSGNSGEGSTPGLSVLYGSGANNAAAGANTFSCTSGSGDLSGGGTVVTIGTSGTTCAAITISEAPVFDTSVTVPLLTTAGALTIQTTATAGADDIVFQAAGSEVIRILENGDLKIEKGTSDVTVTFATPGSPTTYTFSGASGTVLLDSTAPNTLFAQDGNSFGGLATIGTNDNNALVFEVNGSERARFDTTGNLGIGVTNASEKLQVNGAINIGNTFNTNAGTIRWTGLDFQGYNGTQWLSLTSGGGGGSTVIDAGPGITKLKSSNQVVNNSTTLINDSDLFFPIAANESRAFRFLIHGNSNTLADIKFAVTAPSGATCAVAIGGVDSGSANLACGVSANIDGLAGGTSIYEVTGSVVNGSTAGNVQLQWAQATARNFDTTVFAGSYVNSTSTTEANTFFRRGGNAFGATAALGTTDNFGLNLIANNTTVLSLASSGLATFNGGVTTNGLLTINSGGANITGGLNLNNGGITNAGSITGVGANITASAGLTIASSGSNDLTLNSGSGLAILGATTLQTIDNLSLNLQKATDTTLTLQNSGAGTANLNLSDGGLQTGSTTRLTNGGALQNITGLTIASGGASITGNVTFGGSSDRLTVSSQILGGSPLIFQGATDNGFATTLALVDPTSNNTITLPNGSGMVVLDTRSITTAAGSGLTGGGNLSLDRSLSLDINGLNSINTTSNSDYIAVYDSNTSSVKKVSRSNFLQGIIGALQYLGTWNASTNTPTLSDATGSAGQEYAVSVGGTQNLGSGNITFGAGDFIIHNGTRWELAPSASNVASVFGRTGAISAQSGDYTASQITNVAAGNISSTTLQAAINELDNEKLSSLNGLSTSNQTFANDTNMTISSSGSTHTLGWSGQLSVARGGTGLSSLTANGIVYGNGSGALQVTSAGTSGQLLVANGSGVPTFVSLSGDATINAAGALTIGVDRVALGTDTTGNYIASLGTLTGLSVTGNSGESSTPVLSVIYGATASSAVQGNTLLICPSGSGNLTGGGNTITLGSGGTCNGVSIVNNPTFTTSVTTPLLTSSSGLTISSGGSGDITIDSASSKLVLAADDTTLERTAAGTYTIDLIDAATTTLALTNSGAGTADLNIVEGGLSTAGTIRLTNAGALQNITTLNLSGAITGATATNTINGLVINGGALSSVASITGSGALTIASGGSGTLTLDSASNVLTIAGTDNTIQRTAAGTTTINLVDGGNTILSLTNSGAGVANLNIDGSYQRGGVSGLNTLDCASGQYIGNATVAGGIITVGSCENDAGLISDARLKENIVQVDSSTLDKMKGLNIVYYDYKCHDPEFADLDLDCSRQTGVIAQELEQIFPELVTTREDGFKQINFRALSFYNMKAVAELAKSVDSSQNGDFNNVKVANSLTVNGVLEAGTIRADHIEGLDYVGRFETLESRVSALESETSQPVNQTNQTDINLDNLTVGQLTANGAVIFEDNTSFKKDASFGANVNIAGHTDVQNLAVNLNLVTKGAIEAIGPATFKEAVRFEKDVLVDGQINILGYANVQGLTVNLDLVVRGSLELDGPATFKEAVRFEKDASFEGNVAVKGQATFNNDTAGEVTIKAGEESIEVKFKTPKLRRPIITLTLGNGKFAQYSYRNVTEEGFEIVLNRPAEEDLIFSWVAILTEEEVPSVQ